MRFETKRGGTPLNPDEADGLKLSLATQGELDAAEAVAIEDAFREIAKLAKKRPVLDETFLFSCHRLMFRKVWKWAGKVRTTEKSIGVEPWRIRVELLNLIEDVKVWIELESYDSQEILARFHHRLVWIHCFVNGNGRHARLMTDYFAEQNSFAIPTWGVETGLDRMVYLNALRRADGGDLSLLIAFMFS